MDDASKGASALASKDFTSAIAHYSRAISLNPQAVDYYIKRSIACTRISPSNPAQALSDAEIAVVLAHNRGKRELIAQAQLRRGIALFGLERWVDAEACFAWVKKLTPKEASLGIWEKKVEGKLKGLAGEGNGSFVTVKEKPDVDIESLGKENQKPEKEVEVNTSPIVEERKSEGVQTPASKIRHEWYQTPETVVVTLFAKGVPKDRSTIDIQPQSLELSFPLPTGSDFSFSLDPLFSKIDTTSSTHKILSTKVEFVLKKSTPGQKWSSLEGTEVLSTTDDHPSTNPSLIKPTTSSAPAYPTSSKSGPKNWDKVASDLTRKPKAPSKTTSTSTSKNSPSNPNPSSSTSKTSPPSSPPLDPAEDTKTNNNDIDDEYDSDTAGDPVNGFFKKLFKGADPDTQRAMMKSYQESNGTALSTNWEEVGKGTVETSPPEGMVARKWGD